MTMPADGGLRFSEPGFFELFTPKFVTILKEGYGRQDLRADLAAGLTVAIVALPLSMAIAIASGTTPDRGLYAAIIGGFLVSLLGGSRFQIGGPAGAFIVLVSATVTRHGIDGLILATLLSGIILLAIGFFRLGTYVKFIPYPVTVGFTAGIAVIIFISQLRDLLGLPLEGAEPAEVLARLERIGGALFHADPAAVVVAALTLTLIVVLKEIQSRWPGLLIAVLITSLLTALFNLPVETIGSRFGGIPHALPMPHLPGLSWERVLQVLPDAVAFALLGAIESLLSAVVADGMTGRRHRSNCELVAQGVANIGSALFGGFCVTGAIARTASNIRAGARGPMAGMLHAVFLLLFLVLAAPLANYIPLPSLAAVLCIVAWGMVEKFAFLNLLKASWGDAAVLLTTFFLTIFRDLTEGILIGFGLGTLLFLNRIAQSVSVEFRTPLIPEDQADDQGGPRQHYDGREASDPDRLVYRIPGAFFFGTAATVAAVLERIADQPRVFVLDFSAVPFLDSTAANTLESFARKATRSGTALELSGVNPKVRQMLEAHGVRAPLVTYAGAQD